MGQLILDWIHTPTSPESTRTPQPQEAVLPLVLFIISPRGNPPPPHWSRVLHHNGGPNQYESCVFVLRVRRVRPRDLSELGCRLVGRKSLRAPQCSNLEGFAGTRDPTTMAMISPSRREVSLAEQLCRSPRLVPPRGGEVSSQKIASYFFLIERLHIGEDGRRRATRGPTR